MILMAYINANISKFFHQKSVKYLTNQLFGVKLFFTERGKAHAVAAGAFWYDKFGSFVRSRFLRQEAVSSFMETVIL
jgi:hypothetical protein